MSEELERLLVDLTEDVRSRYYGKYRGKVTDVDDPEKLGRIKAKVPEVYAEEESPWALPVVPFAGKDHGLVLLPEVDDGVWIEFEAGNISRPLWTGCWWGRGELPAPGDTKTRALVTTAGHKLVLDDNASEVQLLHSGGAQMKMTDDDLTLSIGQSEIKMTSDQISLKIGTTEVTMTMTDMTLKGGIGQVKLSASGTNVNNGAITVT